MVLMTSTSRNSSVPTAAGVGWYRTSRRVLFGGILYSLRSTVEAVGGHERWSNSCPERYGLIVVDTKSVFTGS